MLSLTRDINPTLPDNLEQQIRSIAITAFERLGDAGRATVRLLYDQKAGTLYFNEVNPIPGPWVTFCGKRQTTHCCF